MELIYLSGLAAVAVFAFELFDFAG